jgi:alpha-galactosidase
LAPISGAVTKSTPETASGEYWMQHGVDVDMRGDFQASAFRLERVQ